MGYRGLASVFLVCGSMLAGCSGHGGTLGTAPTGAPVSIAAARKAPPGSPITVRGEMVEK